VFNSYILNEGLVFILHENTLLFIPRPFSVELVLSRPVWCMEWSNVHWHQAAGLDLGSWAHNCAGSCSC